MSPRMGRPKIDNPKDERVTIRLDEALVQKLDENAQYFQENRTDSIRRSIERLNQDVKKK